MEIPNEQEFQPVIGKAGQQLHLDRNLSRAWY